MHLRAHVFLTLARLSIACLSIAGCGLTLDVDPPDPEDGMDGGGIDGGTTLDGATPDGATPDGSRPDAGPPDEVCRGRPDGTACGDDGVPLICVDQRCRVSFCGDGIVDERAGERCDDGNDHPGDGCEPVSCVPTCTTDEECEDFNVCNGAEVCGPTSKCERGTPPFNPMCETASGGEGSCDGGVCIPVGCGNGIVEHDEECDDGNNTAGDGCEPDCTRSCESDDECQDGDLCNGRERCTEREGCVRGLPIACAPEDRCHVAMCSPRAGCVVRLIDADGDGHAPRIPGVCGDDCDDGDPSRYEGAPEQCNGRDDDCDGEIDEDIEEVDCYPDDDADGYGDERRRVRACVCPAGTIRRAGDCFDVATPVGEAVNPGQTRFFRTPYCRESTTSCSYDYDCDGSEEREFEQVHRRCSALTLLSRCAGQGWREGVPACGVEGTWVECDGLLGPLGLICTARDTRRTQTCR